MTVPLERLRYVLAFLFLALAANFGAAAQQQSPDQPSLQRFTPEWSRADHAHTIPLRDMVPMKPREGHHEKPIRLLTPSAPSGGQDTALQTLAISAPSVGNVNSFAGVGQGDYGFTPNAAPPDTNLSVGATQVVQWVNESFGVFSKTGTLLAGPTAGNTLFQALGATHPCAVHNDGDPIAQYDKQADRWVLTQFSVTSGSSQGFWQCVAVSATSDATGSYHVYAFNYGTVQFNDYPKLGVWNNAYYITYNIFNNGSSFGGAKLCALDRASMIAGTAATQICFQLSSSFGGVLPADLDGATPPPAGSPEFFLNFGANSVNLWKISNVNFTAGTATLSGPTNIPVAAFAAACSGGGSCIPQAGTAQRLDSLADRLMYRLAYRNFGDHEALVVNHSITSGTSAAIRWYEIRSPGGTPTLFQQGTFAPDANFRWMGSAAMDHVGNIAVGYSVSSSTINPGIRFTGRAPTDPAGTLGTEITILDGTGSQTGGLNRWGDYSSLSVDPADDCTLWYTTEYLKASGSFNWSTRIATLVVNAPVVGDFSVSATPASQTVTAGGGTSYTATVTGSGGFSGVVGLTASGLPAGASASFNPGSVTGSGSSTMSVTTSTSTPPGTYTLTITGTSGSLVHSATVTLVVTPPPAADFTISVSPTSITVPRQTTGTATVTIGAVNGFTGTVNLTVSGQGSRVTPTFNPTSVTGSGTSTLSVRVGRNATRGTRTLTITGTSGGLSHSTTLTLIIP